MIENNPSDVSSAFEILLEEVEAEVDFVNGVGSKAFAARDYEKAREALERAGIVSGFRDRVAALRKEWDESAAVEEAHEDEQTKVDRRNLGRMRRGVRTPESRYYQPILRALADMGGSGRVPDVLARVHELMKADLRDVDHEPLASNADLPRWRNTAQWARNTMAREGLLKGDAPRGVWELSDAGRRRLEHPGA